MKFLSLLSSLSVLGCVTTSQLSPTYVSDKYYKNIYAVLSPQGNISATAFAAKYKKDVYLITAGHVCAGDKGDIITLRNYLNQELEVKSWYISDISDVCILDYALPRSTHTFKLAPKNPEKPQDVHHLGHPAGRELSGTSGMLVGWGKKVTIPLDLPPRLCRSGNLRYSFLVCDLSFVALDTTVPGAPGSSGAPLFNNRGEVLGVISYLDTLTPGFLSAAPVEDIIKAINDF